MAGYSRGSLTSSPTCDAVRICTGQIEPDASSSTGLKEHEDEESNKWVWGFAAVVVLLILGGGWYFVQKRNQGQAADGQQKVSSLGENLLGETNGRSDGPSTELA